MFSCCRSLGSHFLLALCLAQLKKMKLMHFANALAIFFELCIVVYCFRICLYKQDINPPPKKTKNNEPSILMIFIVLGSSMIRFIKSFAHFLSMFLMICALRKHISFYGTQILLSYGGIWCILPYPIVFKTFYIEY
uniref:Uncharacterized protein n=2 Tax=Opuntia streptacantha TaxID=393608 RepID=A0A7C9F176_OPUST